PEPPLPRTPSTRKRPSRVPSFGSWLGSARTQRLRRSPRGEGPLGALRSLAHEGEGHSREGARGGKLEREGSGDEPKRAHVHDRARRARVPARGVLGVRLPL